MEFSYSVFLLLCLLPETRSLTLGTTETCGIIGKEFTLVCNFSGESWNPSSTRDWRGPPSLTLLISGGTVQPQINGYVESIDSVNTDSVFRLHIQSLAWSNVDVPYQCRYRFGVKHFSINSSIVEDYNTTNDDVKTDNTNGKNILATINLDAITPVPTVTALLNSPSGTSDVTSQAITITSTPNANNAALNTVNITVNYTVSDTDNNITVNLATRCGYTKSYTFKQDAETTTITKTTTTSITTEGSTTATTTTNSTNKSTQYHSSSSSSAATSASTNSISVKITMQSPNRNGFSKKSYTTYIIIGSVGGSALLFLLCVVAVVFRRKFSSKSDSSQKIDQYQM